MLFTENLNTNRKPSSLFEEWSSYQMFKSSVSYFLAEFSYRKHETINAPLSNQMIVADLAG